MAKRKTPKTVDLKPRAEKITDQQLERLQKAAQGINKMQSEIGALETRKHSILHMIATMQDVIEELREEFKRDYGSDEVNIMDGTIKYNENGNNEANPKDNGR
jgi:Mg2+ and Co2+ transporter CorA